MANSNGSRLRTLASCRPTVTWSLPPVPVSPSTANFTEPSLFGTRTFWAVSGPASERSRIDRTTRRITLPRSTNGVVDEVDDDVRVDIPQNQVPLVGDAVLNVWRQLRQLVEDVGGHRR